MAKQSNKQKQVPTFIGLLVITLLAFSVAGMTVWQFLKIQEERLEVANVVIPIETFTVYSEFEKGTESFIVRGVSIPLNESEVLRVFETVMGRRPDCSGAGGEELLYCPMTKEGGKWKIIEGVIGPDQTYFIINGEDKTINITKELP